MHEEEGKVIPLGRHAAQPRARSLTETTRPPYIEWLEGLRWIAAAWVVPPLETDGEPLAGPLLSADEAERLCRRVMERLADPTVSWQDLRLCRQMLPIVSAILEVLLQAAQTRMPGRREVTLARAATRLSQRHSHRARLLYLVASREVIRRTLYRAAQSALDALVLLRRADGGLF